MLGNLGFKSQDITKFTKTTFGFVGSGYERDYDFWETGKYLLLSGKCLCEKIDCMLVLIYDFKPLPLLN